MFNRSYRFFHLIIVLAFIFFACSIIAFFLYSIYFKSTLDSVDERCIHRIREYNIVENISSSYSFVFLNRELETEEIISYSSGDKHSVISKFNEEFEYSCSGTCRCENSRRFAATLSRPVVLVVSAISALIAVNIAKDLFHSHCVLKMSSDCDEDNTMSEIDECDFEKNFIRFQRPDDPEVYQCTGYCLNKQEDAFTQDKPLTALRAMDCSKLTLFGEVNIPAVVAGTPKSTQLAKNKFRKMILVPFCKYNSLFPYTYSHSKPSYTKRLKVSLCSASEVNRGMKNIQCLIKDITKRKKFRNPLTHDQYD